MINNTLIIGGVILAGYLISRSMNKGAAITLDELADKYSAGCDELILAEIRKGLLTYISGRLSFAYQKNSNKIHVKSSLYFQDKQGEWVQKSHAEKLPTRRLTSSALEELQVKDEIVFEIEPPKENKATG